MSHNAVETVMGGVVVLVAAGFLSFAYKSADIGVKSDNYEIKAKFENVGGIGIGSDVRIGGLKVGTITGHALDPVTYKAELDMSIATEVKLPTDSSASISSDGLLGGKYVALTPGGDDNMLKKGDEIKFTQSSISIEELIGKFVFSGGGVDKKGEAEAPKTAPILDDAAPAPEPEKHGS